VLSSIEWKTRGRHALSTLSLALAFITLVASLGMAISGMEFVLGGAADHLDAPDDWRAFMTIGTREALASLVTGAQLTILQLFLWAAARRRIALSATR
jgi:hypothetical protein